MTCSAPLYTPDRGIEITLFVSFEYHLFHGTRSNIRRYLAKSQRSLFNHLSLHRLISHYKRNRNYDLAEPPRPDTVAKSEAPESVHAV